MWFLDWWTWLSRYVECTSAAIQSLESFKKIHPEYRRKDIEVCIKKAMNFIESRQSPDGSWWVYEHNNSTTTSINPLLGNWLIDEKSTYAWSVRYGSWGVCYTYGTWFGVTGLVAGGRTYENSLCIRKACDFLLSKQLPSGGWGESYLSSQNKVRSLQKPFARLVLVISSTFLLIIDRYTLISKRIDRTL